MLPLAPWVFGAVGSAYAVLPGLMLGHVGDTPIAFSALMTVVTLGAGLGVQVLGKAIDTDRSARASVVSVFPSLVSRMGLTFTTSKRVASPYMPVSVIRSDAPADDDNALRWASARLVVSSLMRSAPSC